MSDNIIILMISVSTFLGALGLTALIWGIRTGQFDDKAKFIDGARFDGTEELKDAIMMENRQKKAKEKAKREKNYMPAD